MTGARAEDRADIAQKSRSVLGGWWAFYRRPIAAGGHMGGDTLCPGYRIAGAARSFRTA
jgi:hypothetical protein